MRGLILSGVVLASLALASCGAGEMGELRTAQRELTSRIEMMRKAGLGADNDRLSKAVAELDEVERKIAARGEKP